VLGFSKSVLSSIGGLVRHLTFSCLVTTDIAYHIELLERALEANEIEARLLRPLDIQYLAGCAMQRDGNGWERYHSDQACKNLRKLGLELSSGHGSRFGGIRHINNNHWIAFLISPVESTIYLTDSLRWPTEDDGPPAAVEETVGILQWWLTVSCLGSNKSILPFRIVWLPIAHQRDSTSCGFFALNALMHCLIPTKYHLCTSDDTATLHVEFLTSILDRHDTLVSDKAQP
jgi:hypothetical protein